ncbi:unnamed protein product [Arabis nemorensis]|uniref:Uncharacterized protein n=1 Tax=Arabis nemorensis TaxID=586526 RepID=A0A565BHC4_9BRAS|nr:unnamed protein product [Arabis nemorensis]
MLEKEEGVLLKKAATEVDRAKEFTRAKIKHGKNYMSNKLNQQVERLGNFHLRILDQMIMLEVAKATTETVDALTAGAYAMKNMQKATYVFIYLPFLLSSYITNIDDVDKTMDEINEQTENMKQIQEALSAPNWFAVDFDEKAIRPVPNAPEPKQHFRPATQKQQTTEEDELAALHAEMAL